MADENYMDLTHTLVVGPPPLPSFDEWYAVKYNGSSFERDSMHNGQRYDAFMRELTRHLRDYTTDMARMGAALCR